MRLNYIIRCFLLLSLVSCEVTRKEENQTKVNTTVATNPSETNNSIGLKIGMHAPDIGLPDPDGNIKTLSSLRGKYILLDFWAGWCGPCRFENPNVVRLYQKYKNKGFDVYSVSLDSDKKKWMSAIEADGMEWTHVSDLKKWESAVIPLYHIDAIPMAFLLGKDGVIIAKDLRGEELGKKLAELLEE